MRFRPHVGKEFSAAFIILMFLLLTVTFVLPSPESTQPRVVSRAYSPTTIAAASLPIKPIEPVRDWLDALNWMRVNLEPTDVVVSWWDYGYWITNIANKTTLADNGALNTTQIGMIGRMFMANETGALEILEHFNSRGPYKVTYVVVFQTFRLDQTTGELIDAGYGDEGKWRWMARIGGLEDLDYGNRSLGTDWFDTNENNNAESEELIPVELGRNSTLYKLMQHGREMVGYGSSIIELEHFEGPPQGYFSETTETAQNVLGTYGFVPLVSVYKINYD